LAKLTEKLSDSPSRQRPRAVNARHAFKPQSKRASLRLHQSQTFGRPVQVYDEYGK